MATHFFWDEIEDNVSEEFDENGVTTASYTTEPTLYGSVLCQERTGERRYFHFDGQGSTDALTDSVGVVTDTRRYSAFGHVQDCVGTSPVAFQYNGCWGYRCNSHADMYSVRWRQLSALTGRWMSQDPFGFPNGVNRFAYVLNNPVEHVDPSGTKVHVFAYEGTWGTGVLGTGLFAVNPAIGEAYAPMVAQYGDLAEWHYHSQAKDVPPIIADYVEEIDKIARTPESDFPCCYPRIVVLGYSRGGATAYKVVEGLSKKKNPVIVDAVFTIDPAFLFYWQSTTKNAAGFRYCRWDNYYQTVDQKSLLYGAAGTLSRIYGDKIDVASNNLMNGEFWGPLGSRTWRDAEIAHVGLPLLPIVRKAFAAMLREFFVELGIRRKYCCAPGGCPVPLCLGDKD